MAGMCQIWGTEETIATAFANIPPSINIQFGNEWNECHLVQIGPTYVLYRESETIRKAMTA